jgi:hypothetical protein
MRKTFHTIFYIIHVIYKGIYICIYIYVYIYMCKCVCIHTYEYICIIYINFFVYT